MKPTCYTNTNTFKYNFINMCGSIIPLKSKLYYDENNVQIMDKVLLILIKNVNLTKKTVSLYYKLCESFVKSFESLVWLRIFNTKQLTHISI